MFIRELGKKFDKGKIGVIAENKEKYISFQVDVVADKYVDEWGKIKEKKIQLRFMGSMRFMASSSDSLSSNLVGVSGMSCNLCGESCEITHVDEYYVAHGKCKKCYSGYSKLQLNKDSIFNDFDSVGHNDEQFRYYSGREFIHTSTCQVGISSRKRNYLLRKRFIVTLT